MRRKILKKILITIFSLNTFYFLDLSFPNKLFSDQKTNSLSEYIRKLEVNDFYILGPGDVFEIAFSENTLELQLIKVGPTGKINLKRFKELYVEGLTISELVKVLNYEYSNYLYNPDVTINMVSYRPVKVYIDGEVVNPGFIILPGVIKNFSLLLDKENQSNAIESEVFPTLFDVIRKSGVITAKANISNIKISRINPISDGGGRIKTNVNILKTLSLEDISQNIRIKDGDNIKIPKSNSIARNE